MRPDRWRNCLKELCILVLLSGLHLGCAEEVSSQPVAAVPRSVPQPHAVNKPVEVPAIQVKETEPIAAPPETEKKIFDFSPPAEIVEPETTPSNEPEPAQLAQAPVDAADEQPNKKPLEFPERSNLPIRLANRKDEEIDLGELTLVPRTKDFGVNLVGLENCTVRFTIDYDPLPYTQGTLTRLEPFEIELDPNFPVPDNSWCDVEGGNSKVLGFRDGKMLAQPMEWAKSLEVLPGGKVRIQLRLNRKKQFRLGDKIVLPDRQFASAVRVAKCTNCTIEATVYSSPSMGVIEFEGKGNTFHIQVTRKPETDRMLGVNADAFHSRFSEGTRLEDSRLAWSGDDLINIHSSLSVVVGEEKERLLIMSQDTVQVGEATAYQAQYQNPTPVKFTDVTMPENDSIARAQASKYGILEMVARRSPIYSVASTKMLPLGTIISQDGTLPKDVEIKNVECDNGFGGIKLKCAGKVEKLHFHDCLGVLHIGADRRWLEGPVPRDIQLIDVKCERIFRFGVWGNYTAPFMFVNYDDVPGSAVEGITMKDVYLDGKLQKPPSGRK